MHLGCSPTRCARTRPLHSRRCSTYRRWLPGLRGYLDRHGLDGLYAQMDALAELDASAREQRLETLLAADSSG